MHPLSRTDIHLVERLFRPLVRVKFSWEDFLASSDASAQIIPHDSVGTLEGIYSPWYYTNNGAGADFRDPAARPVRPLTNHWSIRVGERENVIWDIREDWAAQEGHLFFTILTYGLSDDLRIAMDGNHRLASLRGYGHPFTVMEVRLDGPKDSTTLADIGPFARALEIF
jgi:hypothetical protein